MDVVTCQRERRRGPTVHTHRQSPIRNHKEKTWIGGDGGTVAAWLRRNLSFTRVGAVDGNSGPRVKERE